MTTQQRATVSVSCMAIVTLAGLAAGCGTSLESNQAACERAINHMATCNSPSVGVPFGFDLVISQFCATIPEASECDDWSALADCVTSISCTEPILDLDTIEACGDLSVGLEDNACFPSGFGF